MALFRACLQPYFDHFWELRPSLPLPRSANPTASGREQTIASQQHPSYLSCCYP